MHLLGDCNHYELQSLCTVVEILSDNLSRRKNGPLLITLNCHLIQLPPCVFQVSAGGRGCGGVGMGALQCESTGADSWGKEGFMLYLLTCMSKGGGGGGGSTQKKQVCVNYVTQGLQDGLVSDVKWQVQLVAVKSTCCSVLITFSISDFGFTWTIWSLG